MGFTTKRSMWYDLSVREQPEADVLCADVHVPVDSKWFKGHFPGYPVLPGVAQLSMVAGLIGRALNMNLAVRAVSRVRFRQMVRPDDRLTVLAEPKPDQPDAYVFRITKNSQLVCSGNITIAPTGRSNQ